MVEEKIISILENNGYDAYYVGGCVRDELLGVSSLDKDIVTNASIDHMIEVFKGSGEFGFVDEVGKNFGVVIVDGIEVAQYRTEVYNTVSKPDVMLTGCLFEDSKRRDFTVNAMYRDVRGGIVDPQNGKDDLANRMIRSVGNPRDRFEEDPSRIMRGIYLAAKLGFGIEETTARVMGESVEMLELVPNELKGKIIKKSIVSGSFTKFIELAKEVGILSGIFPEFGHMVGLVQNPKYHKYDVWEHTVEVVRGAESKFSGDVAFVLGALYHDVAKGLEGVRGTNKEGMPNDLNHEEIGAPIAYESVMRFGFGKVVAEEVSFYTLNHGIRFGNRVKLTTLFHKLRETRGDARDRGELYRRWVRLLALMECDAMAFADDFSVEMLDHCSRVRHALEVVFHSTEKRVFFVNELPVNGKDLIELGIKGKRIGELLELLVVNNVVDRETALKQVDSWYIKGYTGN